MCTPYTILRYYWAEKIYCIPNLINFVHFAAPEIHKRNFNGRGSVSHHTRFPDISDRISERINYYSRKLNLLTVSVFVFTCVKIWSAKHQRDQKKMVDKIQNYCQLIIRREEFIRQQKI